MLSVKNECQKCGEGVRPKCCNYRDGHNVAFWGHEVLSQEVEVKHIKMKEKVSYVETLGKLNKEQNRAGERAKWKGAKSRKIYGMKRRNW